MMDYEIEFEIHEGDGGRPNADGSRPDFVQNGICAWMYRDGGEESLQVGHTFRYPEDLGEMCPWLVDSLTGVVRALEHGGTLTWKYTDTPYEKVIDPDGVTTEYVRCIDPTDSGIVIKVTRTALTE